MSMTVEHAKMAAPPASATAEAAAIAGRALIVGERINTAAVERGAAWSPTPLAFKWGESGFAAVFRYGAVVMIGLSPAEEDSLLENLRPHVAGAGAGAERIEETVRIRLAPEGGDQVAPDGVVSLSRAAPEHFLVIADILAKSAALDRDERQVASVFDIVEPWAKRLSETGRPPGGRRRMIRLIGEALMVKARVAGRIAALEKPDVVWDRPDLDRLYGRLEDEYEIRERAEALTAKLGVLGDAATALTDLIDTERALRLEMIIVALIAFEVVFGLIEFFGRG